MNKEKTFTKFEPSMKLLSRIMKMIMQSKSIGKTALSQKSNINYHRLSNHLEWLEKNSLIEYKIEDGKVKIKLSERGIEFVALFSNLSIDSNVNSNDKFVN